MTLFRVWAPARGSVDLHVADRVLAMERAAGGWWELSVADLPAEVDYAFALDGGEPLPDPRSPWQPDGVTGRSRTVPAAALRQEVERWDVAPLRSAVLYELHVGTFTPEGTFEAAIERLDHLVELGVTHVELLPVAQFPGRHGWGYDGVDLYAPHAPYGGPRGLARLVDACHARGLAVLLDVVYNHLGPHGNFLGRFGPYFTDRYATPWGDAPNLDGPESDEVRRFFLDDAIAWLERYRFDGLRVDATHAILDTSPLHFLEELATEVHALAERLGRPLVVIPESDANDPRLVTPRERGGFGCDAQWSDDLHHALHALLTGEREGYYADFGAPADLARALENVYVYDGRYSRFRRRRHGRSVDGFGDDLAGERFLAYAQNHDQTGNRARGERLSHLVSEGRLRAAAALVLTSPFVPLLFQGEEWGARTPFRYFTDHPDPELGRAVREGRRREFAAFGWDPADVPDPQDETTFLASKLDWSERERAPHAGILSWYRELVRLRRGHPALATADRSNVRVRLEEGAAAGWFALERGPVTTLVNLAPEPRRVPLPTAGRGRVLLAWPEAPERAADALVLAPDGVAVHDAQR